MMNAPIDLSHKIHHHTEFKAQTGYVYIALYKTQNTAKIKDN